MNNVKTFIKHTVYDIRRTLQHDTLLILANSLKYSIRGGTFSWPLLMSWCWQCQPTRSLWVPVFSRGFFTPSCWDSSFLLLLTVGFPDYVPFCAFCRLVPYAVSFLRRFVDLPFYASTVIFYAVLCVCRFRGLTFCMWIDNEAPFYCIP